MSAASWPLQTALYAHLLADPGVAAELGDPPRLYDAPPEGAALPHAVLGEARSRPYPGLDGGEEHDIRIQIYSRHAGRKEVKRLFGAVGAALDGAAFPIDGHRLVGVALVSAEAFRRDPSGLFSGTLRFRAVTEKA
jgi:hypothetical protein